MAAPVNVRLENPTIPISHWQADQWITLNREIGGNPEFFPLTIKAAYVIGVIHDICESVTCLLRCQNVPQATYIPAYGVFASGIEVLGRCITGNNTMQNNTKDLKTGFRWLVSSSYETICDNHVLVTTPSSSYTVIMLSSLRHFAAHGQASTTGIDNVDHTLLNLLRPILANGLERYWSGSLDSEDLCNNLAKANIIAFRNWPVFKSWSLFERNERDVYESVSEIFNKFDWGFKNEQDAAADATSRA